MEWKISGKFIYFSLDKGQGGNYEACNFKIKYVKLYEVY